MIFRFDPRQGLVIVPTRLWGPSGDTVARLALDTGATRSVVSAAILVGVGYDPATIHGRVRISTASGVEFAAALPVEKIEALGLVRTPFLILCHTLPPSTSVDGLLGLDFLRSCQLAIDFREGVLSIR